MCVIQWSGTGILGWLYFRNALKEVRVVPYNPFSSRALTLSACQEDILEVVFPKMV